MLGFLFLFFSLLLLLLFEISVRETIYQKTLALDIAHEFTKVLLSVLTIVISLKNCKNFILLHNIF